jgi:hypothetical protein
MSKRTGRITPENITELKKDEVFVFGSNESGIHGAGAALLAKQKFGAKEGVGYGPTGQCFAFPTKSWEIMGTLPIAVLECFAARFYEYALMHPKQHFLLTKVGCGLAGYTPEDIAPLFGVCETLPNVSMPVEFWDVIEKVSREEVIKGMEILNDGAKNELSNV